MKRKLTILIADRNAHVRELLRREMMAENHEVLVAKNSREIIQRAFQREPLDLLILDPDLPDAAETMLFQKLHDRIPALPIILHAFSVEEARHPALLKSAPVVEKSARSIEALKELVARMLNEKTSR